MRASIESMKIPTKMPLHHLPAQPSAIDQVEAYEIKEAQIVKVSRLRFSSELIGKTSFDHAFLY